MYHYWLDLKVSILVFGYLKSAGLIILRIKKVLGKLGKNYRMIYLTWKFPFWVFKTCLRQICTLILLILNIKIVLRKFEQKLQNDLFELEISILGIWKVLMYDMVFRFACFVYLFYLWKNILLAESE